MKLRSARGRSAAAAAVTCIAIALTSVGLSLGARAGEAAAAGTGAASQARDLEDLAWIAGHWGGEAMGGQIEEAWFGPAGRSMSGSFRLVRDDLAIMYELLLLEQDEDGEIYYRFKHVGRGWEPREETPLEFRLTALDGRKATFRNTAPGPPENGLLWFTYESPTDAELRVTIHGSRGGAPTVLPMRRR